MDHRGGDLSREQPQQLAVEVSDGVANGVEPERTCAPGDAMGQALLSGNRIEIRGFGSFGLNYRPPRVGRNPKSGEKVQVPDKYVPHFKAGKELRERVDANYAEQQARDAAMETQTAP